MHAARPHWCGAGSKTVSDNQEIHNYYDEISTHIKYKLNEYKGLTAAWQQTQNASSTVDETQATLARAHEEVSSRVMLIRVNLQQSGCNLQSAAIASGHVFVHSCV